MFSRVLRFFRSSQALQELINLPFAIFKHIAIPLDGIEEYRSISLRQILSNMGASETNQKSEWRFVVSLNQ